MHKRDCKAASAQPQPDTRVETPSADAVPSTPGALLDALARYDHNVEMAESCCKRLTAMAGEPGGAQALAAMRAIELLAGAATKHMQQPVVLRWAFAALRNMCAATDGPGCERKGRAVQAGALGVAITGMRSHALDMELQEQGCGLLRNLCLGVDASGVSARRQRAGEGGALEVLLSAAQLTNAEASLRMQERCLNSPRTPSRPLATTFTNVRARLCSRR